MSSRTRMLGAGRAGSTAYGSNVNMVQFGDKLQGLAPQATQFFIRSGRGGRNNYRKRADGDKRNFVFCMNQLGGVGRARSQFKIDGVNQPDGARACVPYPYSLIQQIRTLLDYFRNKYPDRQLAFVGDDVLSSRLAVNVLDLTNNTILSGFSSSIQSLIRFVHQYNGHGYALVLISKDTKYVSQETYLGLPLYLKDEVVGCSCENGCGADGCCVNNAGGSGSCCFPPWSGAKLSNNSPCCHKITFTNSSTAIIEILLGEKKCQRRVVFFLYWQTLYPDLRGDLGPAISTGRVRFPGSRYIHRMGVG